MTQANESKHALIGRVVSDKRDKTRKVEVTWSRRHPLYDKVMKQRTMLHVDDPKNESKLGDMVKVQQIKPVSKTKAWGLVAVVEEAAI